MHIARRGLCPGADPPSPDRRAISPLKGIRVRVGYIYIYRKINTYIYDPRVIQIRPLKGIRVRVGGMVPVKEQKCI